MASIVLLNIYENLRKRKTKIFLTDNTRRGHLFNLALVTNKK